MADSLLHLPTDNNPLNHHEVQVFQSLFKDEDKNISHIITELKDAIIGGVLFALLSLPNIDELIKRFIPSTSNSLIILITVKTLIFIALFWIILNFALSKKE